jgi:glyoxylate reductase
VSAARPRVFVTRRLPVPIADLTSLLPGAELLIAPDDRAITSSELTEGARGAVALVTQLTDPIDAAFLDAHPSLEVVANVAVGHENLAAEAGAERGVFLTNTPGVLTDATADLTLALLLAQTRRIREGEDLVRSREFTGFSPSLLLGRGLRGRTLGIVGFGRIGQAVAIRARAFGLHVLACSRRPIPADVLAAHRVPAGPGAGAETAVGLGVEEVSFAELLRRADVVSLHVPLTADTRALLDRAALFAMKPGALLLNTARGPLVDEDALADALAAGHLGGAGLDVYEHEPTVHPRLLDRADVVLLPHLGSATHETREAMVRLAFQNVAAALRGETPPNVIAPLRAPARRDLRLAQKS